MTIGLTKTFLRAVAEFDGLVITEHASRSRYHIAKDVARRYCASLNLGAEQLERYIEEYQRTPRTIRKERLAAWHICHKQ